MKDNDEDMFGPVSLEQKLNQDLIDEPVDSEEIELSDEESTETTSEEVPEEVVAKKHGHLSKEDYAKKHGSLDGYKTPEEFNKFGKAWEEVSDVIKGMKKSLDERDKQIDSLVKYNDRIEERAIQRARAQLEQQLQQAKQEGDVETVEHLTREKAKADFQASQNTVHTQELERMEVERDFREQNKHWININPVMTARVEQIDAEERLRAQQAGIPLTYKQLAGVIQTRMRLEFPDVMLAPTAGNSAPNLSSARSATNKQGISGATDIDKVFNSLDNELQTVYKAHVNMMKRTGKDAYSKKEYIEKLRRQGEI